MHPTLINNVISTSYPEHSYDQGNLKCSNQLQGQDSWFIETFGTLMRRWIRRLYVQVYILLKVIYVMAVHLLDMNGFMLIPKNTKAQLRAQNTSQSSTSLRALWVTSSAGASHGASLRPPRVTLNTQSPRWFYMVKASSLEVLDYCVHFYSHFRMSSQSARTLKPSWTNIRPFYMWPSPPPSSVLDMPISFVWNVLPDISWNSTCNRGRSEKWVCLATATAQCVITS